ncbi:RDD family protein [Paenibacillus donghaensis]|uniref:RDD family protein n=1 Tax=Paenibacillus donghaensis TaxID=414771 RepID=UPI0012FC0D03|nr:RDD family protein [Paenibacillus donghaensis]
METDRFGNSAGQKLPGTMKQTGSTRVERLLEDDFVGFGMRVLISLIDALILAVPSYLLDRWVPSWADSLQNELPLALPWILIVAYYVVCVPLFGGTPGRLILGTRIVNAEGKYPGVLQALLRHGFYIINSTLALLLIMVEYDYTVLSEFARSWQGPIAVTNFLMGGVVLADVLAILFTVRKRALHDLVAGTYVVYKAGLEYAEAVEDRR